MDHIIFFLRKMGLLFGATIFVLWIGSWIWLSGLYGQATQAAGHFLIAQSVKAGFKIDNILVQGRENLDAETLLATINLQEGDALFGLNLPEILTNVEALSWVKSARVQIRYPNTVFIDVEERQPLALWHQFEIHQTEQHRPDNNVVLIDKDGVILTRTPPAQFQNLPIVTGEKAHLAATEILSHLAAEPSVVTRVQAAAYISERRWDLKLKNGVIIHLPESDVGLSLRRLAKSQAQTSLLDKEIISVDARYEDRLIIKTKPGAVQTLRAHSTGNHETDI